MTEQNDDIPAGPLSEQEIKALRVIIREDDRWRWFWSTARVWAGWISLVAGGLYASWDVVIRMMKAAFAGRP